MAPTRRCRSRSAACCQHEDRQAGALGRSAADRCRKGYTITAIATDLQIPRQTLVLPNGDILVAEGRGGGAPEADAEGRDRRHHQGEGDEPGRGRQPSDLAARRDGDGVYEVRTVFAEDLNAPYGLALVGGQLYVANQDALVRFDYRRRADHAPAARRSRSPTCRRQINHHWTKALAASADGRFLYVGIGSNSNITERGMAAEVDRAMVWQVDAQTGAHRPYATGLRNPTALAIQPGTGQLWAVVNERDEIGPNLVPDYLTSVREGGFYGWPYSYWGQNVDTRVRPQDPQKVASAIRPDYAWDRMSRRSAWHSPRRPWARSSPTALFVGEHGSWNRSPPVGYKVIFVPFRDGRPAGPPVDFVSGFMGADGKTRGRPVGVTVDPRGALIVADDLSNTIWRVTPVARPAASSGAASAAPPR